jgi:hypothetical protein
MSRWGPASFSGRQVSGHSILDPRAPGAPTSNASSNPSSDPSSDNRRELRRVADGPVTVRFGYQKVSEVQGKLMDVSESGFRMAHECITLETGQTVEFSHAEASGNARVVWNRIVDQRVETGFFVVQP